MLKIIGITVQSTVKIIYYVTISTIVVGIIGGCLKIVSKSLNKVFNKTKKTVNETKENLTN